MGSSKNPDVDLDQLRSTVESTIQLIATLSNTSASEDAKPDDVNALNLASDASALVRAHATKLSLLMINKPFTPSAIIKILRELVAGPLPALASAVELCSAAKYTKTMSSELQWQVKRVFRDIGDLVRAIPLDGNVLSNDAKNGTGTTEGNGSLAITGVVWKACDGVVELRKKGIAGLLIKQAEDYRELIEDALWELQEWSEETGVEDEEDPAVGSDEEDEAQAAVDSMFGPQKHIPVDDPDKIRSKFELSSKRLRLVMLMYQAVVKRRFKTLPPLPQPDPSADPEKTNEYPSLVSVLDKVLEALKQIPEITDELASAFYALDGKEIDLRMEQCFSIASTAVESLNKNWSGRDDEFTKWGSKFQSELKKGAV